MYLKKSWITSWIADYIQGNSSGLEVLYNPSKSPIKQFNNLSRTLLVYIQEEWILNGRSDKYCKVVVRELGGCAVDVLESRLKSTQLKKNDFHEVNQRVLSYFV